MNYFKGFEEALFDFSKAKSNEIKVIGVGIGGCNTVNYLFQHRTTDNNLVDLFACDTDYADLQQCSVPNKLQLGKRLTNGLGSQSYLKTGQQSALESMIEINKTIGNETQMVLITAGMGGGTGSGAAPVIAQRARGKGILTVAIVTLPFQFEGQLRFNQALIGIKNLRHQVDSIIVIDCDKVSKMHNIKDVKVAFSKVDETLSSIFNVFLENYSKYNSHKASFNYVKDQFSNIRYTPFD